MGEGNIVLQIGKSAKPLKDAPGCLLNLQNWGGSFV